MSNTITLYGSWFCPYVQRVWIALEEKGIVFEYMEINPYRDSANTTNTKIALSIEEKRSKYPEFVNSSPRGLVPALRNGQYSICDSMVCLEYIEDAFCNVGTALMPSSPEKRGIARYWCVFINEKIIPHYYKMLMRQSLEDQDQAKADLLDGLHEFAKSIDTEGPYFFGASFSIVDIALLPWFQRIQTVSKAYRDFQIVDSNDSKLEHRERELHYRLHRWFDAIQQRPSYLRSAADTERLIQNYSGYANNSATSDVAMKFRGT